MAHSRCLVWRVHATCPSGIRYCFPQNKTVFGPKEIGRQVALAYLTPHQHGAKHYLETIEEVVTNDDDHGPARGPALTGANGFDAGGGCRDEEGMVSSFFYWEKFGVWGWALLESCGSF